MGRAAACWLAVGLGACAAPASSGTGVAGPALLAEQRIDGSYLDARAFVAEAAFLFPQETRDLTRSLLRAEFAAREAERLGLAPDAVRVEAELKAFAEGLSAELGPGGDFNAWALQRYGRPWDEVRRVLVEHLERNQIYQLCVRAEACTLLRVRMHWLVTGDETEAASWARQLRSGADPRSFLDASLLRGGEADGSFAPMAARLPPPHEGELAGAAPGLVVGPLRFDGDRSYWVGRVAAVEQPMSLQPPVQELLAGLDARPIDLLEGRTWFEAMLRRYTANDGSLPIVAPQPAFLPASRPSTLSPQQPRSPQQ